MPDRFADIRAVADAVLYEGYVLYPYRASATKNHARWQFGVLMPPDHVARDPSERSSCRTELVMEAAPDAVLHAEVRFLHLLHRSGGGLPEWDETEERRIEVEAAVAELRDDVVERSFAVDAATAVGDDGARRDAEAVAGLVRLSLTALPGPYGALRLRVDVENRTAAEPADRDGALRHALVAAHTMLAVEHGRFHSMTEPPEWAAPAVACCTNEGTWPVLGGSEQLVLAAPIILGDNPQIAPESPGELYDATEIDEILTLRTMTLTDEEKAEARATDPRAAAVIDQVDGLPPEQLDKLHGALRYLRRVTSDPDTDSVVVSGVPVQRGSRVRLRPGARSADAQDLFLDGRIATVEAVLHDIDGREHLGVTPDDDPELAEVQRWHGRYLYFAPDEVEPIEGAGP